MQLILIRHPPVAAVGLCYGRLDLPATTAAVQQAFDQLVPQLMPQLTGQQPLIFSSPLQRAQQLAARFCPHGQPILLDDLQEMDFGAWEGQAWDSIQRDALDAWAADIWHYRVGVDAGIGGETVAEFAQRCQRAKQHMQQLMRQAQQAQQAQQQQASQSAQQHAPSALCFSHAGVIRMLLADAGQLPEQDRWTAPIDYATPYILPLCPTR